MPATPEGLPELVTRDQIRLALQALGVTDRSGIYGFEARLNEVTFKVHTDAHAGGKSAGRMEVTAPIVGTEGAR
jgi:hypothetical protein